MTPAPFPITPSLRARIRAALAEDLGEAGDVTSNSVFPPGHLSSARIVAKADGVVAGIAVACAVFEEMDTSISIEALAADGDFVIPGDIVMRQKGPTRSLLSAERTALNFLQRMSGIATLTSRFASAAAGRAAICDTRKTTPLWRDLEKHAVACGGGTNHRFGLFDMVMLKDTHADGAGGLVEALKRVAPLRPGLRVAAEARDMNEVRAALEANVDLLMLDNMSREELREAIGFVNKRVPIEITGGVTLETVADFAALGVDRISIGALTHSAPALDFSMRIELGS